MELSNIIFITKMSSEKFESFEDDLNSVLDSLKEAIDDRILKCSGEEKKNAVRSAESKLEEAALLVQEMEQESKAAPPTYRMQMMNRLRNYRKEIEGLTRNLKRNASETEFNAQVHDKEFRIEASNRHKLMSGIQSLTRTSESIARSQQIASETDAIGTDIIEDLSRQRDVLDRTKGRLIDTDSNLSKSRRIMRTMARRVMTDKMILIAIILVELGTLAGLVYWKFFSKKK